MKKLFLFILGLFGFVSQPIPSIVPNGGFPMSPKPKPKTPAGMLGQPDEIHLND